MHVPPPPGSDVDIFSDAVSEPSSCSSIELSDFCFILFNCATGDPRSPQLGYISRLPPKEPPQTTLHAIFHLPCHTAKKNFYYTANTALSDICRCLPTALAIQAVSGRLQVLPLALTQLRLPASCLCSCIKRNCLHFSKLIQRFSGGHLSMSSKLPRLHLDGRHAHARMTAVGASCSSSSRLLDYPVHFWSSVLLHSVVFSLSTHWLPCEILSYCIIYAT